MKIYVRTLKNSNGQGHFSAYQEGDMGRLPYNPRGANLFAKKCLARRLGIDAAAIALLLK